MWTIHKLVSTGVRPSMDNIVGGLNAATTTTVSTVPHPLLIQSIHTCRPYCCGSSQRQLHRTIFQSRHEYMTSLYMRLVPRWRKNLSRLYARRILDVAAASAAASLAAHRARTHLEGRFRPSSTKAVPFAWKDWSRPDWEETAMSSVGNTSIERFWMATRRLFDLSVLASPFLILVPYSYVSERGKNMSWDYALWAIEKAGPTWIKLMQWASTRQDLFSPEFCAHFSKLQDSTKGHSWKETQRILQEQLGEKGMEALEMEDTPIGSGCIAQVSTVHFEDIIIHPVIILLWLTVCRFSLIRSMKDGWCNHLSITR